MPTNVPTRIDHFAWVISPENVDRYQQLLNGLFGVRLLKHPKPTSLGPESGCYISFVGGLELVAPKGDHTPMARKLTADLATKGEFPTFCVMRVPDHEKAAERIRAAGYEVGANLLEADEATRRAFLATWTEGVADMIERPIMVELPGTALLFVEIEFEEEPAAYADRVGRLDRIAWVLEPGRIEPRVKLLEALFEIEFERDHTAPEDVEAFVSWDGGLEFLAPTGTGSKEAKELSAILADRGESLYSATFAVADLAATVAKAKQLGLDPGEEVLSRPGADETRIDDFVGMRLIASQPTGTRARVAA